MKRAIHIFFMIIVCVIMLSITIEASDYKCIEIGRNYKRFYDLDGDGKKEEIFVRKNEERDCDDIYINSNLVCRTAEGASVGCLIDLFQEDNYIEMVAQRWYRIYDRSELSKVEVYYYLYRYNGKFLYLYDIIQGMDRGACKGKKILNQFGDIIGANGRGIIKSEIEIVVPENSYCDAFASFVAEYSIKKGKAQMIEKEYPLKRLTIKTKKDWIAYKKASAVSNKKLFKIKRGTKCTMNRIKITPKYTFIRVVVKDTKKVGWVIVPTSQVRFSSLDYRFWG